MDANTDMWTEVEIMFRPDRDVLNVRHLDMVDNMPGKMKDMTLHGSLSLTDLTLEGLHP